MPPKGSGKSRKKVPVAKVLNNGSNAVNELKLSDKVAKDDVENKMSVDNVELSEVPGNNENHPHGRYKKGRVYESNSVANGTDPEESKQESEEAEVVPKRGRKKADVKAKDQKIMKEGESNGEISESTGTLTETVKDIPEFVVDSENPVKETKVAPKRGRKKAEVKEKELTSTQEGGDEVIKSGDSEKAVVEDNQKQKEDVVPVKRGRRNVPIASVPIKLDPEPLLEKEERKPLKKTRGGRNAKQQSIEPVSQASGSKGDEFPVLLGGRKKKNIEEPKEKETKKGEVNQDAENIDENVKLVVTVKRSSSLDKRAQEEAESLSSSETKTAEVSSKSAKGKRKVEDKAEGSKPAKVLKESSKSSSKKEKIPDVTDLDFSNQSTSPQGKLWNLKIASWNINGIRAWLEKDGMSYLHHEKPDVLCVQETKCSDDKLPDDVNVEGYHCYWLAGDKDGYSGVGLLSKQKPMSVEYGIGHEEHDNEGRVITAEYDTFYVVTTYVPNSGRGLVRLQYRMQWDKDFCAYLKKLDEKKPVILCGDLNVAHEEIDIANPKTNKRNAGFTKEERDGFSAFLSDGFVDTFRHLYPDTKAAYTFWTYMMNARAKNVGWRLDYFVISEKFTDNLCDSVIRKDVFGSDHCPVALFLSV